MIYILSRNKKNSSYLNWVNEISSKTTFITEFGINWFPPSDCSLVITHDAYRPEPCGIVRKCVNREIPVLILSDGILEYRNSWIQKQRVDS